jgi:Fe-S-cluster-containing dehydrogenase component
MKALLVNNEYCTGCHSCEVSCKDHLQLPKGEFGIKVTEVGPFQFTASDHVGAWEWTYTPIVTQACDLCADRTELGKMPLCVQHCQAWCMYYGEIEDLVKKIDGKTRWTLLAVAQ